MKGKPYTSMPADAVMVNKTIVDPSLVNRLRKMRVVLLINGSTVSAGEVVTGAFKDNKRATIIGTSSFGKAVGFLTRGLPFGGLLSLTKAKYVTPSGYDVSDKGIEPTIVVEHDPTSSADEPIDVAVTVLSQPENSLNAAVEP
jgi:carboxyl-terminal processing protease